ncbi:MAG: radical SAM protein, partial [Muribaculaceae bacterium]|nr:radical SAM protein [Muribaculaceae bacterium]
MSDYIEKEISGTKRYSFPAGIKEIPYKDKWLIVSPLTANWIVLDNPLQLSFLHLLYEYNLDTALSRFEGTEVDAQWVIVQLEARNFESTQTHLKQESSSVHLYLTNKCNMRCPHCYMYAGHSLENELNRDEIITLLNDLTNSGISSIVFSGGEPLLNHNFKDYVLHASKNGMAVEVLSNGSLWNDSLIDELAPYLSSVQISIDGYDEESNSLIRGKGNFTKALHTVDRLIQCGVKTSVAMVPKWSENLEREAPLYVKFAIGLIKKYNTKAFDFNIVGDIWEGREINLGVQEKKRFQKIISQIYRDIFGPQSEDSAFVAYHKGLGIEENCAYGNL